ncbi:MAG: hypothetical protein JRF63_04070 [Deltaproteobacteria bacterium]|nr:hypothetical protein [Deltaproteobacteria bacterium]
MPWEEIKIAAIGLGVSCVVTVIVSIIGYAIAARRRTLGQSVVTWFGNLFVVAVFSVIAPIVVCGIWGPEGFFSSVVGWIALIIAVPRRCSPTGTTGRNRAKRSPMRIRRARR